MCLFIILPQFLATAVPYVVSVNEVAFVLTRGKYFMPLEINVSKFLLRLIEICTYEQQKRIRTTEKLYRRLLQTSSSRNFC